MLKILLISIAFWACSMSACRGQQPEKPLIFLTELDGGPKSCLIALRHLTTHPAVESDQIIDCEKRAKALVMEANPVLLPMPFWSNYERKTGDPDISSLSDATNKKIVAALKAAQYNEKETEYFLSLHPIAIYRALLFSRVMTPKIGLFKNLDMQLASIANSKNFKIIEMEGMQSFFQSERQLEIEKIDSLISQMCDLLLQPERLSKYAREANQYASASDYESIDAGWRNKFRFNTVALGLPSYSILHDVDSRNPKLVDGMLTAMKTKEPLMIFIGSAHIGGPNGVLSLLAKRGVKVVRIQ
jgi:uncharacterized protein YbaP (TraB family)